MVIVPTDSPSVFSALNTLVFRGSRLAIVRPDNPPPGVAGFIFDLVEEDSVELESDITDHYVEENFAVQDHIALRPEMVSVDAAVAELVYKPSPPTEEEEKPNPLPTIPEMTPELSPGAEQENASEEEETALTEASVQEDQTLFGYYQSQLPQQPNQTKQSMIFGYFYQLWKGRQLFTVETPWGYFSNMAIQSLRIRQGPTSKTVSNFSVTFKKVRTSQTISVSGGLVPGRSTFQSLISTASSAPNSTAAGLSGALGATSFLQGATKALPNLRQLAGRAVAQQASVIRNGTIGQIPVVGGQLARVLRQINTLPGLPKVPNFPILT